MGKPFKQELTAIESTIQWSNTINIMRLRRFIIAGQGHCIIVGSGGSSSASYLLADLLQRKGRTCQVMTPLELYHTRQLLGDSQVLLISASGRNKDINFALKAALAQEPRAIGCLTMSSDNPLTRQAKRYSICETFEFDIPTRKDGFLATNTLVGTWALLLRATVEEEYFLPSDSNLGGASFENAFGPDSLKINTLIVLYGNRGKPVAVDIESKCTEAGLVAVQLADFRNFGHGRHHWIAKHATTTAVVAVVTPGDEHLWAATAAVLPPTISCLVLGSSTISGSYLPLLVESFHLIDRLGELRSIDPGRPGVPEFGRQLYHLNPASYYPLPKLTRQALAVRRKERSGGMGHTKLDEHEHKLVTAAELFVARLTAGKFGSLVVDYDGTLGDKTDKEAPLAAAIIHQLLAHVAAGFVLGVATGRGKSVAGIMRNIIPEVHWPQVLIGYYNGTVVRPLGENLLEADVTAPPQANLLQLVEHLAASSTAVVQCEIRTHQVTIQTATEAAKVFLLNRLEAYLAVNAIQDIALFTSGNCIDAVHVDDGSKPNVLVACQELARSLGLPSECLCIGDQGRYPGNDFLLLTTPYSLSVDEVSSDTDSCWNLAGMGQRHVAATQQYLEAIKYHAGYFKIALPL